MENVLFQRNARLTARTSKHVIFKYREYMQDGFSIFNGEAFL